MRGAYTRALLAMVLLTVGPARAEPDSFYRGDGTDGDLSPNNNSTTTVNSYAKVTEPLAPGDLEISITPKADVKPGRGRDDDDAFQADDLVLVLQPTGIVPQIQTRMSEPLDLGASDVGRWEFARLASADMNGSKLVLKAPLMHAYAAGVTQVIRVPEYSSVSLGNNVTLQAEPWDASRGYGGVIAFLVTGDVTVNSNSKIVADGAGFRGGQHALDATGATACANPDSGDSPSYAQKGEGVDNTRYTKTPGDLGTGRGNIANGGGGGICVRSGGGGGGNAGFGGKGGRTGESSPRDVGGYGGVPLLYSMLERLTFGGGGGSGHARLPWVAGHSSGGRGGGIVFIRAANVTLADDAAISAAGAVGLNGAGDAGGGGGAGGTVLMRLTGTLTCTAQSVLGAKGGEGGDATTTVTPNTGGGGGGGGGRVLYQANAVSCIALSVDGGPQGGNNAFDGGAGVISRLPGAFPNSALPAPTVSNPGPVTKQRRPTITGTAQADRQVIIYLNGVEAGRTYANIGTASSGNRGFSFTVPQDLSDGVYTVTGAITYQGVYSPRSTGLNFTVDATKPLRPLIDTLAAKAASEGMLIGKPALTLNTGSGKYELSISGRAEPGATVNVRQLNRPSDTQYDTASFTDSGNTGSWTVKIAQLDGQALAVYKLEVTATDVALNQSETTTLIFNLDTQAPIEPLVTKVGGKTPTGPVGTCSATPQPFVTTQLPLIEGTAEVGSTVSATLTPKSAPSTPYAVAQTVVTGTPGGTASWSSAPVVALPKPNDVYTLTVKVTDPAGNQSPTATYCFELDATAPARPVVLTLGNNSARWTAREGMRIGKNDLTFNSGSSKYELAITGSVEPGSKGQVRQLRLDGTEFASAPFDDSAAKTGNWAVNIAQQESAEVPYKLEVTSTDAAGNPSEPATMTFTLDPVAPLAPQVAKVDGKTPAIGACGAASVPWVTTRLPLLEGTAEARSSVTATLTPKSAPATQYAVEQTQANGPPGGTGAWSTGPTTALPQPNDEYTLTVTVTDEAGNTSPASTFCFALDATVPAPLLLTATTLGNQTVSNGMLIGLAGLTTDSKLRISGSAEAHSTVVLKLIPLDPAQTVDNAEPTATNASTWFHEWTGKVSGAYAVEALVKDAAGNKSTPVTFFFDLDLIRPTVTLSGRPSEDNTTASRDMAFGFAASERVQTYECTLNDSPVTCANPFISTVGSSGTYQFKVWVTDMAGNKSLDAPAATRNWTVDTDQPLVFIRNLLSIPHGGSATQQQDITFELRANKVGLDIYCQKDLDSEEWKTPCVCDRWIPAPDGQLPEVCIKTYSGLPQGAHVFVVKARSPTTGAETSENERQKNEWVVDRTKPDTFITEKPGDWVAVNYATVKYTTPTESQPPDFQCELTKPDSTVQVTACTTSNSHLMSGLADGSYKLRIKAIDQAGNEEEEPAVATWTVDTQGPAAPALEVPSAERRYKDLVLRGTAAGEAFSVVSVYLDDPEATGTAIGTATVTASGEWQLAVAAERKPDDGRHSITLKATDRAGNPGALSEPVSFIMDNQPPAVQISGPDKNSASRTAEFRISTDEEGVTFQCKLDLQDPADCGTDVSFSDLEEGPHTLNVYAVDEAGNRREVGYSWSVYLGRDIRAEGGGLGCSSTSAQPPALWLLGLFGLLLKKTSRRRATATDKQ